MKTLFALIGAILLLPIAAFCLFGFLATFEPSNTPGVFLAYRLAYAVQGIACLIGCAALFVYALRQAKSVD